MKTLGVTGGIGSGKSLICRILGTLGFPIYDCDSEAKALYDTDVELKEQMSALFGSRLYDTPEGKLNRALLAQIIFTDKSQLQVVNQLVHPIVRQHFVRWRECQRERGERLCVMESALLVNSPELRGLTDELLLVTAPLELRLERTMQRDKATRIAVLARMDKQMPEEEMLAFADHRITNDGQRAILPQVHSLLQSLGISA